MTQRIMTYVTLLIFTVGNAGLGHTAQFSTGKSQEKDGGRSLERVMQADKAAQDRAKAQRHMRKMSRSLKNLGHRVDRASRLSKSKQNVIQARIQEMSGKAQQAKASQESKTVGNENQMLAQAGLGIPQPGVSSVSPKYIPLPTPIINPIVKPTTPLGYLESQYVDFPNEVLAKNLFRQKPHSHVVTKTDVNGYNPQIRVDYYNKKGKLMGSQHLTMTVSRRANPTDTTLKPQVNTHVDEKWTNSKGRTLYKAKTRIMNDAQTNIVYLTGANGSKIANVQKPEGSTKNGYVITKDTFMKASIIFGKNVASRKLVSAMSTAYATVLTWEYYDKKGKAVGTRQDRSSKPGPGFSAPLNKFSKTETWKNTRGKTLFMVNKKEHFLVGLRRLDIKRRPGQKIIDNPPFVPFKTKS